MLEAILAGVVVLFGLVVFPRLYLQAIQLIREALATEVDYRAPTTDEAKLVRALDADTRRQSALIALGFRLVGDVVLVIKASGRVHVVVRVLISDDNKTTAYIAAAYRQGITMFESFTDTQELVTAHARADNYIETGPTSQRQFVSSSTPIADAYRKHLVLAAGATVTFATLDELVAVMRASHARLVAWRETQPPDTLLDQDLRKMLGGWYRIYGRWIAKRIQTLPRATIHG